MGGRAAMAKMAMKRMAVARRWVVRWRGRDAKRET
jgi:hypothetical protein